jgi:hypothetical protein
VDSINYYGSKIVTNGPVKEEIIKRVNETKFRSPEDGGIMLLQNVSSYKFA